MQKHGKESNPEGIPKGFPCWYGVYHELVKRYAAAGHGREGLTDGQRGKAFCMVRPDDQKERE